jgi:hypothetical protein
MTKPEGETTIVFRIVESGNEPSQGMFCPHLMLSPLISDWLQSRLPTAPEVAWCTRDFGWLGCLFTLFDSFLSPPNRSTACGGMQHGQFAVKTRPQDEESMARPDGLEYVTRPN